MRLVTKTQAETWLDDRIRLSKELTVALPMGKDELQVCGSSLVYDKEIQLYPFGQVGHLAELLELPVELKDPWCAGYPDMREVSFFYNGWRFFALEYKVEATDES